MDEINDFQQEVKIHSIGLQRLIAYGDINLVNQNTIELAKKIISLCNESSLSYQEIQKAIVYADNGLYLKLTSNNGVE